MPWLLSITAALAAGPELSVERGLFDAPFDLEIAPTAGGSIRYSTDGGPPTLPWQGPLHIDSTTIVRAVEVDGDDPVSEVVAHTYLSTGDIFSGLEPTIADDPTYGPAIERTLQALPLITVWADDSLSLYEQAATVEWIDPEGDSLSFPAGLAIVGGASVGYEKTNLRLYFRGEYGLSRLELALFEDFATGVPPSDQHDALTLRSGSHDSVFYLGAAGQYLRNRWMDETQLEMGHLAPHGRYAHLFFRGDYRGLYHVRERFNAAFLAELLGGSEDDYEAINAGVAVDGDGSAWAAAVGSASDFEAIRGLVDVDNFLDYMILNFYAANAWDWRPEQNWMAAGPVDPDDGGFVFHASDSDICLYYDADTNILDSPGPSSIFAALLAESHPDFRARLADRLYAHLEGGGLLTPTQSIARYTRLAAQIDDAVVAESARWGGGWWDRDDEWLTEQARLLDTFFPARTDALLAQVRAAGWYPLTAPDLSVDSGLVAAGSAVVASVPEGLDAELWLTIDGTDPRLPGGEIRDGALGPMPEATLLLARSTVVSARLRSGGTWGPIRTASYEVDAPPSIVLNEWSAVAADKTLSDGGADSVLGTVEGNGGSWLELVIVEDHTDLRGWRLALEDRGGPAGELTFTDADVLSDLRAGTILTVARDLPEDVAYAPEDGDWRLHLQAGPAGPGQTISATDFRVTHREWTLTAWDRRGQIRFGPIGEGIGGLDGISSREVGLLAADPGTETRRDSPDYTDGTTSTFGAPNRWSGGSQDLSTLRPALSTPRPAADTGAVTRAAPQGCAHSHKAGWSAALLAMLLGLRRRRRAGLLVLLVGCTGRAPLDTAVEGDCATDADGDGFAVDCGDCDDEDPSISPDAAEVCDGVDNDCDDLIDDDDVVVDGVPLYADRDGDGFGDADSIVTVCALGEGSAQQAGDCDDDDPEVHPGAEELCDGLDRDCDGLAELTPGASPACAVDSCLLLQELLGELPDGAYWLSLSSGGAAEVTCDMTTDGGGWTLGFLRNSVSTGSQGDFGAGDVSVSALRDAPAEASASSAASMGWIDLNLMAWEGLRLGAYAGGVETYLSDEIPRSALRLSFGEDGYYLYGEAGYYWCGGDASYTDGGVGAINNPEGATAGCRGHGSLGSGWDFSDSLSVNVGLTLCGGDGSAFMSPSWATSSWAYYGSPGAAQAIWVR